MLNSRLNIKQILYLKGIAAAFIATGIFVSPLTASERNVSLRECIKVALLNNPDKLIAVENRKISRALYQIAKAQRGIQVDGQMKTVERLREDSNSNFRVPGVDTNIGLFVGLYARYHIYDKSTVEREKSARLNINLKKNSSMATVNSIVFKVKQAYYELLMAEEKLSLKNELLEKYKEKLKLTRKLFQSGRRPILDISQAEVGVAQATLNYEKAKNEVRARHSDLLVVMGVHENEKVKLAPKNVDDDIDLKYNVNELYLLARHYNPALRNSKLLKRQQLLQVEVARGAHKPKIDLLLALGFENSQLYLFNSTDGDFLDNFKYGRWGPIFSGQVSLSLPLYYGGAISAKVESALSEYNKLVIKEKEVNTTIKAGIRNLYYDLLELKKQMAMSRLIVKNSEKHALLALRSYENGIGSIISLQDAEARVIQSEMDFLQIKYSYLLKLASLAKLVGIEEDKICLKK